MAAQIVGKQLELIKATFPDVSRLALLWNPANPVFQAQQRREAEVSARALHVELQILKARGLNELERVFATIVPLRPLWVLTDPLFSAHRRRIGELAARRVPIVTGSRESAEAGALLAYGPSSPDLSRRSAAYVDRILKGAKPADLPVEEPTTFDLAVNLKTARALGVTDPRPVLLRADRVIE